MKHVHLTWYRLTDGTQADPNDVSPGKDGVLRHKNGIAVALHGDGTPMTIGRAAIEGGNKAAADAADEDPGASVAAGERSVNEVRAEAGKPALETPAKDAPAKAEPAKAKPAKAKQVKPAAAGKGYTTRESKAR